MKISRSNWIGGLIGSIGLLILSGPANAFIHGVSPTAGEIDLVTGQGNITAGDGSSIRMWGYAVEGATQPMQYPGPTLIIDQGATVTINLTNNLDVPASIVFPGQSDVTTAGGSAGELTAEAAASGGIVSYTFTADRPGTYLYHSGTRPDLQVEMGLVGAIIVRPTGYDNLTNRRAYGHADTVYDYEYLMLLTEIDPVIHNAVEFGTAPYDNIDTAARRSVHWMINGRAAPDTTFDDFHPLYPLQPYGALARVHAGERALARIVSAGRELHPFHAHGNNIVVFAQNGRLLATDGETSGPDLSYSDYTVKSVPGQTYDGYWDWTGKALGWDIYGHTTGTPGDCTAFDTNPVDGFADADTNDPNVAPWEYCADHAVEFPVVLPELKDMTFGGWYSGSPFLAASGPLPVGEGGLNLNGGVTFMWHSHSEIELVNDDVFPGGMLTFMVVEPYSVDIELNGLPCSYITGECVTP